MKKNIYMGLFVGVLVCLINSISLCTNAQTVKMLISINDRASEPVVISEKDRVIVRFNKKELDNISSRHRFTKFEKAYPNAQESYLRNIWIVEADNTELLKELRETDASAFPYGKIMETPTVLYTPNDYGYVGSGMVQRELDLIRAKDAWNITKGDSSVLIGITDTYFDTANPDLTGKFARIRSSVNYGGSSYEHGTMVATLAAGNTDNGVGMASIGYNCRLDVSTDVGGDNTMLAMSEDGVRILNGSWSNSCSYDFIQQGVYDAVYDNGTVACFASGNNSCGGVDAYVYPASLDHNISVTAIGSLFPPNTYNLVYNNRLTGYSWSDIHDKAIGFPATAYNHNNKVDIAAPGYGVSSGYYTPSNTANQFQVNSGWGTSFASPIVAGAMGLIFSANKSLSPYQAETILKETAANIDTIALNSQYAGLLGAGRLDAGAAVSMAAGFNVNDPATASMFIAGIEISSLCKPGASVGGTNPSLTAVIANGTPPYAYRWEAVPGNSAVLNAYNIAEPRVTGMSSTGNDLWFRLTVTDSSRVRKVATKTIHATLNNNKTYDLAVRDSYTDVYDEMNNQDYVDMRDWNLWRSPDIWNRQKADGITTDQPEKYSTKTYNYAYVRVHNTGCIASPNPKSTISSKLRVFWSFPSTSHKWASDFSTGFTYTNGSKSIRAGGEITTTPVNIPVIQSGDDAIIRIRWRPVDFTVAAPNAEEGNLSLLARISGYTIVKKKAVDNGPAIRETAYTTANTRKSNNLALNNTVKLSINATTRVNSAAVYFTNPDTVSQQIMNFNIRAMKDVYKYMSGDFKQLLKVTFKLSSSLYNRWKTGGHQGKYLSYDDNNNLIVFDDISYGGIRNIKMDPNEHALVVVEVEVKATAPSFTPVSPHIQEFMITGCKTNDRITTGVIDFQVRYNTPVAATGVAYTYKPAPGTTAVKEAEAKKAALTVYPNPVSGGTVYAIFTGDAINKATVQVTNMTGSVVYNQNYDKLEARQPIAVPVSSLAAGLYCLNISGIAVQLSPVRFVIIK